MGVRNAEIVATMPPRDSRDAFIESQVDMKKSTKPTRRQINAARARAKQEYDRFLAVSVMAVFSYPQGETK
jgi:hypothetical protein